MEKKKNEKKTGYCDPPLETRFSSTNQPVRNGRPKGSISLVALLKKYLQKKIKYEDPETNKIIKGRVADAVVWRLLLNATQGDNTALKEIFERIDGKTIQIFETPSSTINVFVQNILTKAGLNGQPETKVNTSHTEIKNRLN